MCKNPKRGVQILLLAWETPEGRQALKGDHPSSMSIEFSRELMKAYRTGGSPVTLELCKAVRDRIFWDSGHPCCVIDVKDYEKPALLEYVNDLDPLFVLLMGSKVRKKIRADEIETTRFTVSLGFPRGENQQENVRILGLEDELCELLAPKLASVEEELLSKLQ